jgi:hypothetical protein
MDKKNNNINEKEVKKFEDFLEKIKKEENYLLKNIKISNLIQENYLQKYLDDNYIRDISQFIDNWKNIKVFLFNNNLETFFNNIEFTQKKIDKKINQLKDLEIEDDLLSNFTLDLLNNNGTPSKKFNEILSKKMSKDESKIKQEIEIFFENCEKNEKIEKVKLAKIKSEIEVLDLISNINLKLFLSQKAYNAYNLMNLSESKSLSNFKEFFKSSLIEFLDKLEEISDEKESNSKESFILLEKIRLKISFYGFDSYFYNEYLSSFFLPMKSKESLLFIKWLSRDTSIGNKNSNNQIISYIQSGIAKILNTEKSEKLQEENKSIELLLDYVKNNLNSKVDKTIYNLLKELLINSIDQVSLNNNSFSTKPNYFVKEFSEGFRTHLEIIYNLNPILFTSELKAIADETNTIIEESLSDNNFEDFLRLFKRLLNLYDSEFKEINRLFIREISNNQENIFAIDDGVRKLNIFKNLFLKSIIYNESNKELVDQLSQIIRKLKEISLAKDVSIKLEKVKAQIESVDELLERIIAKPNYISYYYLKVYLELLRQGLSNFIKTTIDENVLNSKPNIKTEIIKCDNYSLILSSTIINKGKLELFNVQLIFSKDKGNNYIYESGENILKFNNVGPGESITKQITIKLLSKESFELGVDLEYKISIPSNFDVNKFNLESFSKNISMFIQKDSESFGYTLIERIENIHKNIWNNKNLNDEYFIGREKELKELKQDLFENNKLNPGKIVVVYGQTRAGKSVLVNKFSTRESKNNDVTIVTIHDVNEHKQAKNKKLHSLDYFYVEVIKQIGENLKRSNDSKLLQYHLTFSTISFYDEIVNDKVNKKTYSEIKNKFKKFMNSLAKTTQNKVKILVIIDEFTGIYESIIKGQIDKNFLKELIDEIHNSNEISMIIIGHEHIIDILNDPKIYKGSSSSSIKNKYVQRDLTYLKEESAKNLIKLNMQDRFVENEYLVDKIYKKTGGSAYLINLFCSKMVDFFNTKTHYISNQFEQSDYDNTLKQLIISNNNENVSVLLDELLSDNFLELALKQHKKDIKDDLNIFKEKEYITDDAIQNFNIKEINRILIKSIINKQSIKNHPKLTNYNENKLLDILTNRNILTNNENQNDKTIVIGLFEDYLKDSKEQSTNNETKIESLNKNKNIYKFEIEGDNKQ